MASILIVEDDKDMREMLARLVEKLGHKALLASDGEDALDLVTPSLDLAVVDYLLPVVDGLEVAEKLKVIGIPFIFISSTNDDAAIDRMLEMNPLAYLEKPVSIKGIQAAIRTALIQGARDPRNTLTRVINQAVGMLMERHNIGNRAAFVMLRGAARHNGLSVFALAERLASTHDIIYRDDRSAS